MFSKAISFPARAGLRLTRSTLKLSVKLSARLADEALKLAGRQAPDPKPAADRPPSAATGPASATAKPKAATAKPKAGAARPKGATARPKAATARPAAAAPAATEQNLPEDELVAEVAESGAEDGAGAQLSFQPPWSGYDADGAKLVIERIAEADAAQLALIELYEQSHKARKTVLKAAEKRLRQLTASPAV